MARRAARSEERRFRRLAAQLGLSRHVLEDDGGSEHAVQAAEDNVEASQDMSSSSMERGVTPDNGIDEVEEEIDGEELTHEGDGEDVDEEDDEEDDGYAGELSLTLPSDSASEGMSSDLSLPHSFGHYDRIGGTTPGRPTFTGGISQFDDHLSWLSPGRPTQTASGRTSRLQDRFSAAATGASAASTIGGSSEAVMKKFYEIQVGKVRAQLALSMQAQRELEKTLQRERAEWREEKAALETTMSEERGRLEGESVRLRADLQSMRQHLELEKAHFASLEISDALAEQLSRQREEELSVREYIQLTIHRKVATLEKQLEQSRKSVENLQKCSSADKEAVAGATEEMAQLQRAAEAKERRLQHDLEFSEATRKELEAQVAALVSQMDAMKEEQHRNEAIYSDRKGLKEQSDRLKAELETLRRQHSDLKLKVDADTAASGDLQKKLALLTADKAFLQDAKAQLEEQEVKLRDRERMLQAKVDALQDKLDGNASQSAQIQHETRLHFEKKLDDEMGKFMELSKREIERIRNDGQVVYERENRLLKEARDDALKHVEMLQTRLDSVQSSLDEKILEMTRMESTHSTSLAALRNDLKMRHFEMSQLKMSLEEKATSARHAQMQIEMLEQKVDAHKEEFTRLETTSSTRIAQLEAALEVERNKLKEYELLEIDLDGAVMQTGAIADSEHEKTTALHDGRQPGGKLDEVLTTFGAIPTTTKRRFQQSVLLAQRVVKAQRECMELEQKLSETSSDRDRLEQQVAQLKAQLGNLQQPQSYLIQKLTRREDELHIATRECQEAQSQLHELRRQYQHSQNANAALQQQLQQLLARRGDLDALKSTVQLLRDKLQSGRYQAPLRQCSIDEEKARAKLALDPAASTPTPAFEQPPSPAMSPHMKVSPPPLLASKMTRPPTPQKPRDASLDDQDSSSSTSSGPRWYTKLRTAPTSTGLET